MCIGPGENVLHDIRAERRAQDEQWGANRDHPDGTGSPEYQFYRNHYQAECQLKASNSAVTWDAILLEEVFEAMAELDPVKLRAELIDTAAVCAAWIEAIDRRTA
jgi:hypothetical protein